jgi:hypothetical protein
MILFFFEILLQNKNLSGILMIRYQINFVNKPFHIVLNLFYKYNLMRPYQIHFLV